MAVAGCSCSPPTGRCTDEKSLVSPVYRVLSTVCFDDNEFKRYLSYIVALQTSCKASCRTFYVSQHLTSVHTYYTIHKSQDFPWLDTQWFLFNHSHPLATWGESAVEIRRKSHRSRETVWVASVSLKLDIVQCRFCYNHIVAVFHVCFLFTACVFRFWDYLQGGTHFKTRFLMVWRNQLSKGWLRL